MVDAKANKLYMTPEDFAQMGATLFRRYGWQTDLARVSGVHTTSIHRYAAGTAPVPPYMVTLLRALMMLKIANQAMPEPPEPITGVIPPEPPRRDRIGAHPTPVIDWSDKE